MHFISTTTPNSLSYIRDLIYFDDKNMGVLQQLDIDTRDIGKTYFARSFNQEDFNFKYRKEQLYYGQKLMEKLELFSVGNMPSVGSDEDWEKQVEFDPRPYSYSF